MRKILIICILFLSTQILFSQSNKDLINGYFLKYRLYPTSIVGFFIDSHIDKNIKSIKVNQNDSINYELKFTKNKLSVVVSDSESIILKYSFGKLFTISFLNQDSISGKTKLVKFFPFTWIFNNGLQYTSVRGFNGITKFKQLSGLQTFSKTKIKYKNGRVDKVKNYDWQGSAQNCYYNGFTTYDYKNDTTFIENIYSRYDSLEMSRIHIFDHNYNIVKIYSVDKRRVTGWGTCGAVFYAYDGNKIENTDIDYKFDNANNWIEKWEYVNDTLVNKTERQIDYIK